MGNAFWAAREGDILLHTSMLADIVGAAVEIGAYMAITAAAAAITGLTAGVGAVVLSVAVGVVLGATGGSSLISKMGDWVSSLFPPSEDGRIATGSSNVHTNSKPSARAAGTVNQSIPLPEPEEPPGFIDVAKSLLAKNPLDLAKEVGKGLWNTVKEMVRPTVASPDPRAEPREDDKIICYKHPSSFTQLMEKAAAQQPKSVGEAVTGALMAPVKGLEAGLNLISAGWGSLTGKSEYMAEGSKKVYINSQPAVRSNDRSTCEAKVTSDPAGGVKVSKNVRIGGESLVVREIKSGKYPIAFLASIAMIALCPGRALAKMTCFLAGVGISYITSKLTEAVQAASRPVHAATGAKVLGEDEELDFVLAAHLPLEWQRFYCSRDLRSNGLFGTGWSVGYEVELEVTPKPDGHVDCVYIDEQGRRIEIEPLRPGEGIRGVGEGLNIRHAEDGRWIIESDDGLYRLFEPDPHNPARQRLALLSDRHENAIRLSYDADGRLQRLTDAEGAAIHITLHYELASYPRRLTRIDRYLRNGQRVTLVRYGYDDAGNLTQVVNSLNHLVRTFAYDEGHRLIFHSLPEGLGCHYQWRRYEGPEGEEWRVVAHWTEADGQRQEEYRLGYDLEKGITVVQDSLGRRRIHRWNAQYQITEYTDTLGQTWRFDWNEERQLLGATDPEGQQWRFVYDEQGRQTEETDPLGRTTQTEWLPHWALPVRETDPDGNSTRTLYDERGNAVAQIDPLGQRSTSVYDLHGQPVRITDERGGVTQLRWNEAGQLSERIDCSGRSTRFMYDTHGHLSSVTDAMGNTTRYEHDSQGALLSFRHADGREEKFERNPAGYLTAAIDGNGKRTAYHWDKAGRLHTRVDAAGRQVRFHYDAYGRLTALANENGQSYRFAYDVADRLKEQTDLDGLTRSFDHDVRDHVIQTHWRAPDGEVLTHKLERDAMGRLTAKMTTEGRTDYQWNKNDQITEIAFTPAGEPEGSDQPDAAPSPVQTLSFAYDKLGRLITETGEQGPLNYEYDPLGNCLSTTLPDGRVINRLYYGSGHLHQINLDGELISDFERDPLHREILRTQGQLHLQTGWDGAYRLRSRTLRHAQQPPQLVPELEKLYEYDAADNLIARVRRTKKQGSHWGPDQHTARLKYDATGRILEETRDNASRETYAYDAAANLLNSEHTGGGGFIRNNRIEVYEDKRYQYDNFGRLKEKRIGAHTVQSFSYDGEQRLKEVRIQQKQSGLPQTTQVQFDYDPLGRRTSKKVIEQGRPESRTQFLWEGMRLLAEEDQHGHQSLYIYAEEDSYDPLARVDKLKERQRIHYFQNDVSGLPEELTDQEGQVVWRASYKVWGNTIQEHWEYELREPQNLRFQGQYLDRETGLHYNLFRYYDPDVGRFTQPDPIGLAGGLNLYQYAPNPAMWADPWGWCSKKLGKNLKNRPKDSAAHHIVGDTAKRASPARAILKKHGIDIDSAENGVWLPNKNNKNGMPGIEHNGKHPNAYFDKVNQRIVNADRLGGKQGVLDELSAMRNELSSAPRGAAWATVLK